MKLKRRESEIFEMESVSDADEPDGDVEEGMVVEEVGETRLFTKQLEKPLFASCWVFLLSE